MFIRSPIPLLSAIICLATVPAWADDVMALRGKFAGCENNQKMGLWDLSADSPLIRNDMLRSNYCFFPTFEGLQVRVLERIGKFARVENVGNRSEYLVYQSDLAKIIPLKPPEPTKAESTANTRMRLLSVKNTTQGEIYEINGQATVHIHIQAAPKFQLDLRIPKSALREGFDETVRNQKSPNLQIGGKCGVEYVGVGSPDWYRVKVTQLDRAKKIATFEISGSRARCSLDIPNSYQFSDSKLTLSGANFDELMRPHTAKELSKKFQPFKW